MHTDWRQPGTEGFLGRTKFAPGAGESKRSHTPWSWWVTGASWPQAIHATTTEKTRVR